MRKARYAIAAALVISPVGSVDGQSDAALTIKQLMLERIHPAANDILLAAFRGSAENWTAVEQSATKLQSAADLLAAKNTQTGWTRPATALSAAAADASKAAAAKDPKALAATTTRIDASCTECHRLYRPNVFPAAGNGVN